MATASIVRIGPKNAIDGGGSNIATDLLRDAIVSYFTGNRNDNDDDGGDNNNNNNNNNNNADKGHRNDSKSTIVVSNKYFSANVVLADIDCLNNDYDPLQQHEQKEEGEAPSPSSSTTAATTKEDGCILVFDGMKSNPDYIGSGGCGGIDGVTFDQLANVQEKADAGPEQRQLGDLLRLCVGVTLKPDASPQDWRGRQNHEAEYSRRILWCLDHGYEYVEADLSDDGQRRGHDDRDKEGFARIIEAIEGTVWSSAVMKQAQTKQLKDSYADDKAALKIDETQQQEESNKNDANNTYVPPSTDPSSEQVPVECDDDNTDTEAANRTKKLLAGEFGGDGDENKKEHDVVVKEPSLVGSNDIAKLREDAEIEKHFDQMDSVIQEAKRIREASQNGTISDDERRERAGDAALALLNLMSQFGMEEEEGEDESDDDSEG
jgi:hypothetical protein